MSTAMHSGSSADPRTETGLLSACCCCCWKPSRTHQSRLASPRRTAALLSVCSSPTVPDFWLPGHPPPPTKTLSSGGTRYNAGANPTNALASSAHSGHPHADLPFTGHGERPRPSVVICSLKRAKTDI
ncbi:hypothetical protein CC78DRAFT_340230 [Lojkania enalia]|uniref:Uncharacterized protein n=1 Tax=Lojkania enalia TaxID=147567 RepID=A0A9P4K951_9PLEO|nr:hypothetical protein CC78DRAFT_340230 [Didymosphaeria enalia]